ncbi:hypothetical protein [Paenibacillus lautus]|uniref:hypothetical protein n=1 Tax=Paenibacillus lautus TaxID=1401 RepID=UPI001C7DB092|nr:hypothetical protein [Paenibacillus lautus]
MWRYIQIDNYEKLPITIARNDVTITLNSLNKVNGKVLLNVTVKFYSDKRIDFELSRIRADDNVKGRKSYTTSATYFYTPTKGPWVITTETYLDKPILTVYSGHYHEGNR